MSASSFLALSILALSIGIIGCASPKLDAHRDYHGARPPPPRLAVDRRCGEMQWQGRETKARKEKCALEGNPVGGHAEVLDTDHLRISLELGESISGCGEMLLVTTTNFPDGSSRELTSVVECQQECMPEGPGGGTCWDVRHQGFSFDLEFREPLPHARNDGSLRDGSYVIQVTSGEGYLQPTELVVKPALPAPPRPVVASMPAEPVQTTIEVPEPVEVPAYQAGAGPEVCSRARYESSQRLVGELSRRYASRNAEVIARFGRNDTPEARRILEPFLKAIDAARRQSAHFTGEDAPPAPNPGQVFVRLGIPVGQMGKVDVRAVEAHVAKKVAEGTLTPEAASCLRWVLSRAGHGVMNPSSRGAGLIAARIEQALRWFGID